MQICKFFAHSKSRAQELYNDVSFIIFGDRVKLNLLSNSANFKENPDSHEGGTTFYPPTPVSGVDIQIT